MAKKNDPENKKSLKEFAPSGIGEFSVVAIGSPTGGLEALETFFSNMPMDSGMSFVVITNPDPNRKTFISEILAKYTGMPVHVAEKGTTLKPDNVFVIPPNACLSIQEGRLHLEEALQSQGYGQPADHFFHSLAEDQANDEIKNIALFPEENPCPVLRVKKDGTLSYANRSAADLLAQWRCSVGEAVPPFLQSDLGAALASGKSRELVIRCGPRYFSFVLVPIRERDYVNLYGRDITESRKIEEAMRESERRYSELVQSANSAIIRWSRDGTLTFFNEYAQELFGWSAEEAVGRHVGILVPDEESTGADLTGLVQDIVARPDRYRNNLNENVCRDGRRVWMNWTNRAVFDEQGKVSHILAIGNDVTRRKQAEDALKKNEERYRNFFINNHAVMLLIDPGTGQIVNANPAASTFYGYPLDEMIGMKITAINMLPADQVCSEMELAKSQQRRHFFFKHRLADGQVRDVQVYSGPIPIEGRDLLYSIVFDITQQKRAEMALRLSEEKFAKAFAMNPAAISLTRLADGLILDVNETLLAITGYRREELIGRFSLEVGFWPDSEDRRRWVEEVREKGSFRDSEQLMLKKSGEPIQTLASAETLSIAGEPVILSTWLDITKRKQAETALRESEEQLKRAQEIANLGSWEMDTANRRLTWSDQVFEILGFKAQGFTPSYGAFLEAVHPDDRAAVDEAYSKSLKEGKDTYEIEHRIVRKGSGEIRYVHEKCLHFTDKNGLVRSLGMVHDITERKRAEIALKEAHAELETKVEERTAELREKDQLLLQQNRQAAMGEMINNIAHQWRQPLNALGMIIQSLGLRFKSGEFDSEYLETMEELAMDTILHMSQTIDDFRNYFKPDKEKVRFNIRQPVFRTVKLVEENFKYHNIAIEVNAQDDPLIRGYPQEFAQVLLNILNNARDVLVERKVRDSRITITMGRKKNKAFVAIRDNAGGIPEKVMGKIFEPYFTTKGPDKGTGIGLFMSKNIIEKNMGGKLLACNTEDGAEFRIEV